MNGRTMLVLAGLLLAVAAWLPPADALRPAGAEEPQRARYEYRFVGGLPLAELARLSRGGRHPEEQNIRLTIQRLNEAGAEGWQVVSLLESGYVMARQRR